MQKDSIKKLDYLIRKLEKKMKKAEDEEKGFLFTKLTAEYQKAIRLKENLLKANKESGVCELPKMTFIIGLDEDLV